jgi:hypothetical protein
MSAAFEHVPKSLLKLAKAPHPVRPSGHRLPEADRELFIKNNLRT